MTISRFKATCLAVLSDVQKTGVAMRAVPETEWMRSMRDSIEIHGDTVGPVGAFKGWG
jgi:hypothetical protein